MVKFFISVMFFEDVRRVCFSDVIFEVLFNSKVFVIGWGVLKVNGEY